MKVIIPDGNTVTMNVKEDGTLKTLCKWVSNCPNADIACNKCGLDDTKDYSYEDAIKKLQEWEPRGQK